MPWRERARIMVERGECKTFGEACSKMGRKPRVKNTQPKPVVPRLPYKDD
jgi:hypothetical protein